MSAPAFNTQDLKKSLNDLVALKDEDDGLAVVAESDDPVSNKLVVTMPDRLLNWLIDLRLLRHLPLGYLVPDPALLPVESIRFFHIDRTWADRVIDGVLSAGNIGTVDATFTVLTLTKLRKKLDEILGIAADTKLSGMLIRSELVTRWPDIKVSAATKQGEPIEVLRHDLLSDSILIVLFRGVPHTVQLREPDVGLRFGVEGTKPPYKVNKRKQNGEYDDDMLTVRVLKKRVLDVKKLGTDTAGIRVSGDTIGSRDVALHLQQQAYVATYSQEAPDASGSKPRRWLGVAATVKFVNGTVLSAESMLSRSRRTLSDGGE